GDSSGAVVVVEYIELRPVIAEGTVALPSHGPAANTLREMDFVGMEHDRLISSFTFDPVPPELEDLEVGGFLALGISDANPYGFLGEVLALDRRGNALYVEAARVLMEDVIQQGAGSIHA